MELSCTPAVQDTWAPPSALPQGPLSPQWSHLAPQGSLWSSKPPKPNSTTSWEDLPPWVLLANAYSFFKHLANVPPPGSLSGLTLHYPSSGLSLHPDVCWTSPGLWFLASAETCPPTSPASCRCLGTRGERKGPGRAPAVCQAFHQVEAFHFQSH